MGVTQGSPSQLDMRDCGGREGSKPSHWPSQQDEGPSCSHAGQPREGQGRARAGPAGTGQGPPHARPDRGASISCTAFLRTIRTKAQTVVRVQKRAFLSLRFQALLLLETVSKNRLHHPCQTRCSPDPKPKTAYTALQATKYSNTLCTYRVGGALIVSSRRATPISPSDVRTPANCFG